MNTFKKITLTSAVAFALFAFNACGDDSNSTSASGENSALSSAVEDDESSSSINDNSSSSSVILSDIDGSSSSSSAKVDGKSSSSINKEGSSSSTKVDVYSSSSDVVVEIGNSSSSYGSSSSVKEGSSSSVFDITAPCTNGSYKRYQGVVYECVNETWILYVAPSSSSVASSSSHEYKPLYNPLNPNLSYGEFVDSRDGTKYATLFINNTFKKSPDSVQISFTVFAQNLKYREKMTMAADEQDDDTKVEGYCYHDSTEYCDDWYGAYYQWAEMMALPYECNSKSCADLIDPDGDGFHQGICPKDWHIMTQKEMLAVFYVTGIGDYEAMKASGTFSGGGNGSNKSGLSMVASGRREYKTGTFKEYNILAHFSYPAESTKKPENSALGGGFGADVNDIKSSTQYKLDGTQIRCVKDY